MKIFLKTMLYKTFVKFLFNKEQINFNEHNYKDGFVYKKLQKLKQINSPLKKEKSANKTKVEESKDIYLIDNYIDYVTFPKGYSLIFSFCSIPIQDRKRSCIYLTASNKTNKSCRIFVYFGEGDSTNGGIVIKIPPNTIEQDHIIKVNNQYKWFSKNNNWIHIHSEDGEIKIKTLKISQEKNKNFIKSIDL